MRAPIRYLQKLFYLIRYIIFDILFSMKEHSVTFRCMYILYSSAWIGKWYTKRQLQRAAEKTPNGHSYKKTFHIGEIAITAVAINEDNYSYIVVCESSGDCVLVDVGDTKPVLDSLIEASYTPSAILSTHKHWDHCYGNKEALEKFPHLKIYGSKLDRPHCVNKFVKNGEVIEAGRLRFTAILVPGHTRGHIIYRLHIESGPDCLFTGDFLFVAGIGKMFEGTARRMLRSLLLLDDLPRSTLIFPGHEYSLDNIEFALTLEPSNAALLAMKRLVHDRRAHRLPSVPTTLDDEFAYNPFLRTDKQVLTNALRGLGYEVPDLAAQRSMNNEGNVNSKRNIIGGETAEKTSKLESEEGVVQEEINNEVCMVVEEVPEVTEIIENDEICGGSSKTAIGVIHVEVDESSGTNEEMTVEGIEENKLAVEEGKMNLKNSYTFRERVAVLRFLRLAKDAYAKSKEKLATEACKEET